MSNVANLSPDYRTAMLDTLTALTGTRARIEGTGGGCEWIVVGPLDNGDHLTITDGDAGLPASDAYTSVVLAWLIQRWQCDPSREEPTTDYPAFVTGGAGDLTLDGLTHTVIRALMGADDR